MTMPAPAVITGLGVTAPNGLGAGRYWPATLGGRSGIGRITRFDPSSYPAKLAGEVPGFAASDHLPNRLLPQTDRMTQLALVAADWALADAQVDPAELGEFDMGVMTASSSGGFEFGQNELRKLSSKGSEYVSAYQSFAWFYAVNTGQISIRNGMRGPSGVLVSDQAGGLDAVAQARRQIRKGSKLIVTGGVDGGICPWGWAAQLASGRLSPVEEPDRAFLPFDPAASGHVPGEGGAVLILEDAQAARDRCATAYGTIAGYAATFDPRPGSGREPGLRQAIELALADAGLPAGQIGVVFADAAAIPELDAAEAAAITAVFGPGGRAFAVQAELGVPGDVDALFEGLTAGLREHTGKAELNICVNNAGIMGGVKPEDVTPELFDRLVAVNAKAPLFIVQRALQIMPDGGRIINITSGLTRFANPDEVAYSMTKGAVEQIGLHYAKHLGPRGITVNSVAPGITNNGSPVFDIPEAREQMAALSAFGRVGEPTDVADVVAFLACDDARWVTGAFIDATGGTLLG
jgi:act minimal PKS chain-length factor (CLF/KS beta)